MNEYNHYYRLDAAGFVTHAFSNAFEPSQASDHFFETGGRHFNPVITNELGQYILKLVGDEIVERSQQELDEEWAARPAAPKSLPDEIAEIKQLVADLASLQLEV
ncbi:hypothetical protein [Paenibacillus nasutitermitis]|uniref:Uncharacterized protein n=1 Tax=Paenibacillus nasutitermitis TaxID=1652958 RepID=A0A916ZH07_9BACL|nr:hypothetical protein [Paenibacillus nasutitermitis]GGD95237.1 hypothetical protein GCM10010911_62420 [Paenibacillus nasutitermitis]